MNQHAAGGTSLLSTPVTKKDSRKRVIEGPTYEFEPAMMSEGAVGATRRGFESIGDDISESEQLHEVQVDLEAGAAIFD